MSAMYQAHFQELSNLRACNYAPPLIEIPFQKRGTDNKSKQENKINYKKDEENIKKCDSD